MSPSSMCLLLYGHMYLHAYTTQSHTHTHTHTKGEKEGETVANSRSLQLDGLVGGSSLVESKDDSVILKDV